MVRKKSSEGKPPAKRKAPAKKGKARPAKAKPAKAKPSFISRLPVYVLFAMVCLVVGAGYYLYTHPEPPGKTVTKVITPLKIKQFSKPDFEIFPIDPLPPKAAAPVPVRPDRRPRMVIIIDDLGYDKKLADRFLAIDGKLTYAILPLSPHRNEIAAAAHGKGCEVMLHLPMEPNEYPTIDPGPGAILSAMTPDERIRLVNESIGAIPHVSGVNNHMGSKVTADSEQMNQILSIVKKHGLYFVDSRTTAASLTRSSARLFKIPFAERDVFLDHVVTAAAVKKQLDQLVRLAEKNGQAVGIGHPHDVTVEVLARELPKLKNRVLLIPASEMVRIIGS